VEVVANVGKEFVGGGRRSDLAVEKIAEPQGASVEGPDRLLVGADVGSVESGSDEDSLGAGVGEDAGVHLPVGVGAGVAADGSGGDSGVSADLPVGGQELFGALVVHEEHDEINALDSNLCSKAAAGDDEEGRRAPALVRDAAGGDASAMLAADDKASLDERWDDGDALGIGEDGVGNVAVSGAGELVEVFGSLMEALVGVVIVLLGKCREGGEERSQEQKAECVLHIEFPFQREPLAASADRFPRPCMAAQHAWPASETFWIVRGGKAEEGLQKTRVG